MELTPGSHLGSYEITGRIGGGGMGVVYRARDHRLDREVAIKVIRPGVQSSAAARRRFRTEALALAKLNHPNIAAVYDVGSQEDTDYLVMEYVSGQSLAEALKPGPLPVKTCLALAGEIARALEEAHAQGVVHRDLKPANIIMTPKGHVKVLDFGVAKLLLGPEDATVELVETMGPVGTPRYMSPEQASCGIVDARTDLWGLGAVLFESLTGKAPFDGQGGAGLLRAARKGQELPLSGSGQDVPQEVERIVTHALEPDASNRYQTAAAVAQDLASALAGMDPPAHAPKPRPLRLAWTLVPAVLLAILLAGGYWWYRKFERELWARAQAIPEAAQLANARRPLAAFLLLRQAQHDQPDSRPLAQALAAGTQPVSVTSSPPGAVVEIKDYSSPGSAWFRLGITPLQNTRVPKGFYRWRLSKPGVGTFVAARAAQPAMDFDLAQQVAAPARMSWVDGGPFNDYISFVGEVGPYLLPAFDIDRYEVTNREYQKFVDAGGYQNRRLWAVPVIRDGRVLKWQEAMALFRDGTGRPGPSTWVGGHFPAGQGDYPVSGVSWYEASAYAAFAGKALPTLAQWFQSAALDSSDYIVQHSNISQPALAAVGSFQGLGPYGTYDMAGNVREWVENDTGAGTKFILGGAWKSQTYMYGDPEALAPLDRSPENGFRCVRNAAPLPAVALQPIRRHNRDFSTYQPVPDDVFRAYLAMYAYEPTPLKARDEGVVADTPDWREEKVTYGTAYDNERMAAYLFLPKHVKPPYQAVVFSPSARVLDLRDSRHLGDVTFFDYVVQSGRAVLYPIYYGTYERQYSAVNDSLKHRSEYLVKRSQDLGRSLDYLDTRADIDPDRIAYLGVSMGSADGVIYATVAQSRLKAVVFLDGGYFLDPPPAGGDQADFAPRLKLPVLMVNGRYDYVFSPAESQDPLFRMLGTPAPEKRHLVLDTPHDVRGERGLLVPAVLGWLDRYLGKIE